MKTDKKPIIGFICVMLSCILVIGITIGLLSSADKNKVTAGATADVTVDKSADIPEEPPVEEPELEAENEPELEWGFGAGGAGCESMSGCIAYKSDKNIFDVEDVKLTVYYGDTWVNCEFERKYNADVPVFEILCENLQSYDRYVIREVNENFVSDEYKIVKFYDEKFEKLQKVIFNHSEEIVIPKEVFQGDCGTIELSVGGFNINVRSGMEPVYRMFAYTRIKYEKVGPSKVLLSPTK